MTHHDTGYRRLIAHYEACLERHGDTHRGVDWPIAEDAQTRYRIMLDLIPRSDPGPVSLLDFGCGAGHLLDYIRTKHPGSIVYQGLDASAKFVSLCQHKFPDTPFHHLDILSEPGSLLPVDYVVLNGVLTEKLEMSDQEMRSYMEALLTAIWPIARKGVAFNVMSCQVDWPRDDLFHMPFDEIAGFVADRLSRHFRFRQDYGLFEYTTYVYRDAQR